MTDHQVSAILDGDELQLSAPRTPEIIADVRRLIRDFLNQRLASPNAVADLELAASELTTNVIRHTASNSIDLVIARTDLGWRLSVADAAEVPPIHRIALPPPENPNGRGLVIVAAVMSEMDVVEVDGGRVVRCLWRDDPHDDHARQDPHAGEG